MQDTAWSIKKRARIQALFYVYLIEIRSQKDIMAFLSHLLQSML